MSLCPRERISEALQTSARLGIALIVAPAGFGKSEAVTDAFPDALFVPITEDDCSLDRFVAELLDRAAPERRGLIAEFGPVQPSARMELVRAIRDVLSLAGGQMIVVDDAHRLSDAAVRFLGELISGTLGRVSWVVASRTSLPWPIATWLGRELMNYPIEQADLGFTVSEAKRLAEVLDSPLPEEAIASVVDAMGGWPLAIPLVLTGAGASDLRGCDLRDRVKEFVRAYFDEFVWTALDAGERELLMDVALLDRISEEVLVRIGYPYGRRMLRALVARVPMLSEAGVLFHMHEVVRAYFIAVDMASGTHEDRRSRLVDVLEREGLYGEAFDMLVPRVPTSVVAGFLQRRGIDVVRAGFGDRVRSVLSAIDDDSPSSAERALLLYAGLESGAAARETDVGDVLEGQLEPRMRCALLTSFARMSFRERRCPRHALYEGVEMMWTDRSIPVRERIELLACAALVHAYHERVATVGALVGSAWQLCAMIPDHEREDTDVLLGEASLVIRNFEQAETFLLAGLEAGSDQGRERQVRRCLALLAQLYFEQGQFAEAQVMTHRFRDALIASEITDRDAVGRLVTLGWMLGLADVFAAAEELVTRTQTDVRGADALALMLGSVAFEGSGRIRELMHGVDDAGLVRALQAIVGLKDRPNETGYGLSVPIAYRVEYGPEPNASFFEWTFQALAHWCRRRHSRGYAIARGLLNQPLRFTESRLATWIYDLVRHPYDTYTAETLDARLANLSLMEPGIARLFAAVVPRPDRVSLTPVELEIIREFSKGGSAKEVARRLERSPNTVNHHFQSVARKLRVSGRRQVIEKATSAGLI